MRHLVAVMVLVFGAGTVRAEEPAALISALQAHLASHGMSKVPQHRYALVDLNGDSMLDVVVLLTDPSHCGSGGCTLEVYRGEGEKFRYVSGGTITHAPILVSSMKSHGWRTLIVTIGGGGIPYGSQVALRFEGKRYPGNPSTQPAATAALADIEKAINYHPTSGQAKRLVRFLAGLYNGQDYPFDLTELCGLDTKLANACLDYLNYDRLGIKEVHKHLANGDTDLHRWLEEYRIAPTSSRS